MSLTCKHCDKTFLTLLSKKTHAMGCQPTTTIKLDGFEVSVQRQDTGEFECPVKGGHSGPTPRFSSSKGLNTHIRKVHQGKSHPLPEKLDGSVQKISPQLVATQELLKLDVYVNTLAHLLICISCKSAVVPSQLVTHIKGHDSPPPKIQLSNLSEICAKYGVPWNGFPQRPQDFGDEIEGLNVIEGFGCPQCPIGYPTLPQLRSHVKNVHPGQALPADCPTVSLQQFHRGKSSSYFRVTPRLPDETSYTLSPTDIVNQTSAVLDFWDKSAFKEDIVVDPRNKSPWLRATRWDEFVQNLDPKILCELVAAPSKHELAHVQAALWLHLETASSLIPMTELLVLQTLNSGYAEFEGISNRPFAQHQNKLQTLKNYSYPILGLLCMLLRIQPNYPLTIPPDIQTLLVKLQDPNETAESHSLIVHELLISLWTRSWTPDESDPIPDPTDRFLMLSTLKPNGSFKQPKDVTTKIARIVYCMRLTFLREMHQHADGLVNTCHRLQPWYTEKTRSSFNTLYSHQHLATALARAVQAPSSIYWTDHIHHRSLLFHGHPIKFEDVELTVLAMETEAKVLWEDEILCGLDIKVEYKHLADDLSNRQVGYSFMADPRNMSCFKDRTLLLQAILGNPKLYNRFVLSNHHGRIIWNQDALRRWLDSYSRLQLLQLTRSNITSGPPSRGTEMTALTICNTPESSSRGLVMLGDNLTIIVAYQKTSALTGLDKLIPHPLDGFSSDLMIQDLAIARPFAKFVATICYPDEPVVYGFYCTHLFVNRTELFTTEDLSASLKRITLPSLGVGLNVNGWRHVSTAFRRKLCSLFDQLIEEDKLETVDAQAMGHSRKVERMVYAVSSDALLGPSEDVLLFIKVGEDWQIALRVVPGGLCLPYEMAEMGWFQSLVSQALIIPKTDTRAIFEQTMLEQLDKQEGMLELICRHLGITTNEKGSGDDLSLKRTAPSSFEQSTIHAKRRRIASELHDLNYVVRFKSMLARFHRKCVFCFMFSEDRPFHPIDKCPTLSAVSSYEAYNSWSARIRYQSYHDAICYACHIPQCHEALHLEFEPSTESCQHPDKVAPMAFALFRKPELKKAAQEHFEARWGSFEEEIEWINAMPFPGHKSNLTALFLWFGEL